MVYGQGKSPTVGKYKVLLSPRNASFFLFSVSTTTTTSEYKVHNQVSLSTSISIIILLSICELEKHEQNVLVLHAELRIVCTYFI